MPLRRLLSPARMHPGLLAGCAAGFVCPWLFLHTVLALHYAHQYYWPKRLPGHPETHHGGLEFPGGEAPDYTDFMYFSFVLGACSQTSDVAITSKEIRRLVTFHGTLAFA